MKKLSIVGLIGGVLLLFNSCEELAEISENNLSEGEIVNGLKTALEIGADSATSELMAVDGYFKDEAVKILLPPEANTIISNINKLEKYLPVGIQFFNDQTDLLLKSINRSAEDAASEALPILTNAITSLSVSDGFSILNGSVPNGTKSTAQSFDSLAATKYLEQETKSDLIVVFSKPINASLDKKLVGNESTNSIWNDITSKYNEGVVAYNKTLGLLGDKKETVNANLGSYCTEKALDGLFVKVGAEEKKIRKNPYDWAVDIIQKVFGSVFEE